MIPWLEVAADVALYLAGGCLLALLVRRWRRPHLPWATAGAYLAAALAFSSPALLTPRLGIGTDLVYRWAPYRQVLGEKVQPQNYVLSDPPVMLLPFRTLVRQRLLAGEPPLWSHEMSAGQPLLGNGQSAPFAPLHLAALPLPPLRALTVAAAWQMLTGLLMMHVLMRRLGASPTGAAVAATAFAAGGFAAVWLYFPLGMTAAWLPGVLLGLILLRHGEGGRTGLVLCATAMALSGHPEILGQSALVAAVVAAALLLLPGPGRGRYGRRLAAAGALTLCLAAPALLPVLEAVEESRRLALMTGPAHSHPRFEPLMAAALVNPFAAGSPREGRWQGTVNFLELTSAYAGVVPLALAMVAVPLLGGPHRRRLLAALLGGFVALLVSFGVEPSSLLIDAVPLLAHAPRARLRLFWAVAVAVGAGFGVDALTGAAGRRRRLGLAGLTAVGLLLAAVRPPADAAWYWLWWGAALGAVAAAALALAWPAWRRYFGRVVLAGLAVELALFGMRFNPVVPAAMDLSPPPEVEILAAAAGRQPQPVRVLATGWSLRPHLGALYGLWDPRGLDPMRPQSSALFVRLGLPEEFHPRRRGPRGGSGPPVIDYLAVRFLLTHRSVRMPPPWRLTHHSRGGRIWTNPRALSLFFIPERLRRAEPGEALGRALQLASFRRTALVERQPPRQRQRGRVEIASVSANGFDLRVDSPGALVASSVSHARAWRAVAGSGAPARPLRRISVEQVNGGFLAFRAPPGAQRVRLRYLPAGWVAGMVLAASGLAVFLALTVPPPRTRFPHPRASLAAMPIIERDPWREQYFEGIACPAELVIPTDDEHAWELYPQERWVYNKLLVCETQGLAGAPHGVPPKRFPVFSKPIFNLHGMGVGGRRVETADELALGYEAGHMWMELLEGEHLSTDVAVIRGEPVWWRHTQGKSLEGGMFDYWTVLAEGRPEVEAYCGDWLRRTLPGYSGFVNLETIGGKIAEAHLRFADQWPDLYGGRPWVESVVELYRRGAWSYRDEGRRDGYSVVLFGVHGPRYRRPEPAVVEEILAQPGISSIQVTFHEDLPPEAHAMPPGGFRLAVINAWDLDVAVEARARLALRFWTVQKVRRRRGQA